MTTVHDVLPREVAGRLMISRVQMQFQAAAFACLEILIGRDVDRVYCDYHDDYVVRRANGSSVSYDFYQVKTKGKRNHQWTASEVFSIKKRGQQVNLESLAAVRDSFAGKLLIHSITFGSNCRSVTLQTNVQFDDDVEQIANEFAKGIPTQAVAVFLLTQFAQIFREASSYSQANVLDVLRKFCLAPGAIHIGEDIASFTSAARDAIHRYSEIDLNRQEMDEIASGLVQLVQQKSFAKVLTTMTPAELDNVAGVGIDDLLGILSISKEAYRALLAGADPSALKNASIIQRILKNAGASERMTEYWSQLKVRWDVWLRGARHTYLGFDLNFLLERIDEVQSEWLRGGGAVATLQTNIEKLRDEPLVQRFPTLDRELILGGVVAALVRRDTK